MESRFRLLVWLLLWALGGSVHAQSREQPWYEINVSKTLMGTHVEATVMHTRIQEARVALVAAFMEMERVENLLSVHRPTSEVAAINQATGHVPVRVSAETFAILERAVVYSAKLDGLFDVTIGPLAAVWGFNSEQAELPQPEAIQAVQALVDYRVLHLNATDTTVTLPISGVQVDLGGIAKGYAVDRAVAVLQAHGIANFLLNAGGDLYVAGRKQPDQLWTVGIKHPRFPAELLSTFPLENQAVATSGDYERFFEHGGQQYHHILDPRTGYPAQASLSATVVASSVEEADVLATYLFIAGQMPQQMRDYAFLRVTATGEVVQAPSSDARLTFLDP